MDLYARGEQSRAACLAAVEALAIPPPHKRLLAIIVKDCWTEGYDPRGSGIQTTLVKIPDVCRKFGSGINKHKVTPCLTWLFKQGFLKQLSRAPNGYLVAFSFHRITQPQEYTEAKDAETPPAAHNADIGGIHAAMSAVQQALEKCHQALAMLHVEQAKLMGDHPVITQGSPGDHPAICASNPAVGWRPNNSVGLDDVVEEKRNKFQQQHQHHLSIQEGDHRVITGEFPYFEEVQFRKNPSGYAKSYFEALCSAGWMEPADFVAWMAFCAELDRLTKLPADNRRRVGSAGGLVNTMVKGRKWREMIPPELLAKSQQCFGERETAHV